MLKQYKFRFYNFRLVILLRRAAGGERGGRIEIPPDHGGGPGRDGDDHRVPDGFQLDLELLLADLHL